MAAKKSTKMTPAVRFLRYEVNTAGGGASTLHYIDLAKDLSMVNRRLYRQGRDYHVKKITVVSSTTDNLGNEVSAGVIGDSWVARNAWRRGFDTWTKMQKEAMHATSESIKGTWNDFKVRMSIDMVNAGTVVPTRILNPTDRGGNDYQGGDWDYSKYVSPDASTVDEFGIYMLGTHNGAGAGNWDDVALIKSYAESRATVQVGSPLVPSPASDDPLTNVFDYGDTVDEVLQNIEEQNDVAPYDTFSYPGEQSNGRQPLLVQQSTLVDGRTVLGGFTALCGLIELETKAPLESTFTVLVELAPGNYRGIKADVI
jgi:hypothetical protein